MAASLTPGGEALLTVLAGMTALRHGDSLETLEAGDDPGSFGAAVAVAVRLAEEVDRLGGDSSALLTRVYMRACDLASS